MTAGRMTIGVDASCWLNRRGYGRYTRELLRALLARDSENDYHFFLDAATARSCRDLPDGARPVIVQTARAATEAASASGRRSVGDMWAMRRAVSRFAERLDVFYFPSVYTYFPVSTPAKVAVTIHDTIAERHPALVFPNRRARLFWKMKVWLALRRADLILTVSETARRDVMQEFRLPEARVRVVSDAVSPMFRMFRRAEDHAGTREVLARYGIGEGQRFVLYVGGISPHKNLTALLDAFGSLTGGAGMGDLQLVLAGDFEGDVFYSAYPDLRERAARSGGPSKVVFTSFVSDDDLLHLYNAATVLVLPSFLEGFGLPALEAMACGTPVVVSRAGALPEVVADAGLLFDPGSPEELRERLEEVLGDEGLRRRMVERGLRRAAELSWERSAETALATFRELAG